MAEKTCKTDNLHSKQDSYQQCIGFSIERFYLVGMKELHHICFTSHDEVMFRDEEDHGMFVNLMALRCFSSNTEIVVDAEMSTHVHQAVFSARPLEFARRERMSYTKYFNYKYGRYGRLGQKYTFLQPVKGFMHQMTLSSYILRNGLHHSAVSAAFGYPYCTIRDLFSDNLGFGRTAKANYSRQEMASYLPRHAEFPDEFEMDSSGVFLRRSFMEIRQAEQYYVTPRNYLYQMNRLTDENWFREQLKDETGAPLTLADIEHADEQSVARMLKNESGRNIPRMQDLEVCKLIDRDLLQGVVSVYGLSDSRKKEIARQLFYEYHLPEHQIRRCLVM